MLCPPGPLVLVLSSSSVSSSFQFAFWFGCGGVKGMRIESSLLIWIVRAGVGDSVFTLPELFNRAGFSAEEGLVEVELELAEATVV